jgi:hypothetical protein
LAQETSNAIYGGRNALRLVIALHGRFGLQTSFDGALMGARVETVDRKIASAASQLVT